MNKNQCTMKDVARAVGVSTYTVSRALNGKKDISDGLRTKILAVAQQMGYVPNIAARGLQSGSTKTVALVLDDLKNLYYNILLSKFTRKLSACGYHVTIYYEWDSISLLNGKLMQRVLSSNPDGIISFLCTDDSARSLNDVWKRPLVVIGAEETEMSADNIYFDDFGGGEMITEYLFSQGCEKIGYINATSKLRPGVMRGKGYARALEKHGQPSDGSLVYNLEDEGFDVDEAVRRLVGKGVDAIFCFSDMTALDALSVLMKMGLEKKIRIAGWDNVTSEVNLPCAFTTVGVDLDSLVDDAVNILLRRIGGFDEAPMHKMYPVCLVENNMGK